MSQKPDGERDQFGDQFSAATEYDRMREHIDILNVEVEKLRDALSSILTTVEDASVPYERLKIGAIARAGLGDE